LRAGLHDEESKINKKFDKYSEEADDLKNMSQIASDAIEAWWLEYFDTYKD